MSVAHRNLSFVIAALILGYACWIIPFVLNPGTQYLRWPLSPLMRTDPFYGFLYMLVSLFTLGLVLGYLDPARGMLWGAITGLPMIALSFVEGFLGRSHSLCGTEVALYTVFTLPAILGGLLGRLLKRARLR
jgi:hypothetical protein